MNMKKSIAGVMAGAMAVSAMATTASAWTGGDADQEQIVLSYDLKEYVSRFTDTSVYITEKYDTASGYDITAVDNAETKGTVEFGYNFKRTAKIASVGITGQGFKQADGTAYPINKLYYVGDVENAVTVEDNDKVNVSNWTITGAWVTNNEQSIGVEFTTLANVNADTDAHKGAFLVDNYKKTVATSYYYATADGTQVGITYPTEAAANADFANVSKSTEKTYKTTVAKATVDEFGHNIVEVYANNFDTKTGTVVQGTLKGYLNDSGALVTAKASAEEYDDATAAGAAATTYNTTAEEAKAVLDLKLVSNATTDGYAFQSYTVSYKYIVTGITDWDGSWNYTYGSDITGAGYGISGMQKTGDPSIVVTGGSQVWDVYPMKSSLTTPANVIDSLKTTKTGGVKYTKPEAVLNDVIANNANNENVQLTFTSYSGRVEAYKYVNKDGKIVKVESNLAVADNTSTSDWLLGKGYDREYWDNRYFDQHLYQSGTYGDFFYSYMGPNGNQSSLDNFGSYSAAWNQNLFNSGLVVNSEWTMQLSDTTAFEWGDNAITFRWDSIKADKVTNASNFITSMLLYTPVDWYWDTLDVKVGAAMDESVAAGAGASDDAEEVPEEDVTADEEPVEEDPTVDEEPADEEEPAEDEEFEEEEEPTEDEEFEEEEEETTEETTVVEEVKEETSPKTGNAPIALAVIPVALAAAAVVAKKRG